MYMFNNKNKSYGKPHLQKTNQTITWITALLNSMKLWALPCKVNQNGQIMVEGSDKLWSTGEGNGKPLQYSGLEKSMNSMSRKKY